MYSCEYITDIEAQSYYDFGFGGYKHMVHFNLSINPDKVYRVDVIYTITNDNKDWYQFWLPDDEHTILKSLPLMNLEVASYAYLITNTTIINKEPLI